MNIKDNERFEVVCTDYQVGIYKSYAYARRVQKQYERDGFGFMQINLVTIEENKDESN